MAPIWKDGECQECWKVNRTRTWADMSFGCTYCGGVVIPCWALPDYHHEIPQSFNKSPWWTWDDVSGLYNPEDVAGVSARGSQERTETGLTGLLSRLLRGETQITRGGKYGLQCQERG